MPFPRLFHVSETASIQRFDPRPPPSPDSGVNGGAVWAIEEALLHNYLLPRDCPRVTYCASAATSDEDRRKFFNTPGCFPVVAIESGWWARAATTILYLYELPLASFTLLDACAGYWISRVSVEPLRIERIDNPIAVLLARKVELRPLPELWSLRDAVAQSTLQFSIIRMKNARPRA